MILSDRDIRAEVLAHHLIIDPWNPSLVQPASIDVRLASSFRVFENHRFAYIDPSEPQDMTRLLDIPAGEAFTLHPGEFVLASTLEKITLGRTLAARLEGKSSLGRLGLITHSTAGWIDPGFRGQVTLELSNVATLPIKLYPGMKIGQLCLLRMSSPVDVPYGSCGSRYQDQQGPQPSRSYEDFR